LLDWLAILAMISFWPIFIGVFKPWYSKLLTKTRKEAPSFWDRKRDDLAITVFSNFASLIAGGFVGYWVNTLS
jgi:hypothetical protein